MSLFDLSKTAEVADWQAPKVRKVEGVWGSYLHQEEVLRSVLFAGVFVCSLVCVRQHVLRPNILKIVGDRGSVSIKHQYEMAYGGSNGYVISDVT